MGRLKDEIVDEVYDDHQLDPPYMMEHDLIQAKTALSIIHHKAFFKRKELILLKKVLELIDTKIGEI